MVELSPPSCQSHLPAINDQYDIMQNDPVLSIKLGANLPTFEREQATNTLSTDHGSSVQRSVDRRQKQDDFKASSRKKRAALSLRTWLWAVLALEGVAGDDLREGGRWRGAVQAGHSTCASERKEVGTSYSPPSVAQSLSFWWGRGGSIHSNSSKCGTLSSAGNKTCKQHSGEETRRKQSPQMKGELFKGFFHLCTLNLVPAKGPKLSRSSAVVTPSCPTFCLVLSSSCLITFLHSSNWGRRKEVGRARRLYLSIHFLPLLILPTQCHMGAGGGGGERWGEGGVWGIEGFLLNHRSSQTLAHKSPSLAPYSA